MDCIDRKWDVAVKTVLILHPQGRRCCASQTPAVEGRVAVASMKREPEQRTAAEQPFFEFTTPQANNLIRVSSRRKLM